MAKRLNITAVRLIIVGAVLVIVAFIVIVPILFPDKQTQPEERYTPAFAPAQYAYPEYFEEQELGNGFTWKINESGNIVISDGTTRYHILTDGTIYAEDRDGTLYTLTDKDKIREIYSVADKARETSETVDDYFDNGALNLPLSDSEVYALVGDKISGDDFRKLQGLGLTPDTIASFLDEGLTPTDIQRLATRELNSEEIDELQKAGVTAGEIAKLYQDNYPISDLTDIIGDSISTEDFKNIIDGGGSASAMLDLLKDGYDVDKILEIANENPQNLEKEASINERLKDSLVGTGITVKELKEALDDAGMTPEEYLHGVEKMATEENNSDAPKSKESTSFISNTNDIPPLTVSLGSTSNSSQTSTPTSSGVNYQTGMSATDIATALSAANQSTNEYTSQNNQSGKNSFMASFDNNEGFEQLTKNDIASGTVITMILKTGLNSDLPGMIVAEVTQNVFDSLTGTVPLIPKGTRLIASYDSSVSWGQKRALIAWTQLIRPDGLVLKLPGLPGIDSQGYTGVMDKVNNHTWDLIKSAFLASILDLGVNDIQQATDGYGIYGDAAMSFVNTLESAGQQYLKKQMNIQPTLTIRPGRTIKLLVTQTLHLKPYTL